MIKAMEMWKSQNHGFPHSHRLGGYDEKKTRTKPNQPDQKV